MSDGKHHHDHDHDHPHDHDHHHHESEPVSPPNSGPANPQAEIEDTGSRALSDALRSSFVIVKIVMIILVLVFIGSGVFTVPSGQKAIILRFGKPIGSGDQQLLGPGLHWSFPYPIDEVVKIPIGEMQTVTSRAGWYQMSLENEVSGQEPEPTQSLNPTTDGYTITADGNIMHVRATLRYRITNPLNYVLNFVNSSNVVQSLVDHSVFYASSLYTVNQALRDDALGFRDRILARVKEVSLNMNLGINIESIDIQSSPPLMVRQVFNAVSAADIERRKALDTAQAHANRVTSTAESEASSLVNLGKSEASRIVASVTADAAVFQEQLPYFRQDPALFTARLQAESMSRILTNVQDVIFLPKSMEEIRYQLNRAPRPPEPPNSQPGGAPR